jgi:hypothetical protein
VAEGWFRSESCDGGGASGRELVTEERFRRGIVAEGEVSGTRYLSGHIRFILQS